MSLEENILNLATSLDILQTVEIYGFPGFYQSCSYLNSEATSEEDEIPKEREQLITLKKWSETPTNENLLETQKETEKIRPPKHPKQPDQSTKKTSAVYNQTNFTKPMPFKLRNCLFDIFL